jgi:hypothetical protein
MSIKPEVLAYEADHEPGRRRRAARSWALALLVAVSSAGVFAWKVNYDRAERQDRELQEYLDTASD